MPSHSAPRRLDRLGDGRGKYLSGPFHTAGVRPGMVDNFCNPAPALPFEFNL